jgi:uncharacterized protein (TIRG00374 family)
LTRTASKFVLRLLLGAGLLVLVFQFVNVGDALRAVRDLDGRWLAASVACYVATRVLMALKWWVLLGGSNASISYATVQRALCLSDYYSLLFPNTLAVDVTRVVLLRHHRGGAGFMTAAILADRVINVAATAAISLIALAITYAVHGSLPFSAAVANGVIGVALLVLAAALTAASRRVMTLSTELLRSVQRVFPQRARLANWIDTAAKVHTAMSTMLSSRGTLMPAIVLALAVVLARVGSIFFLFIAVGAPQAFSLTLMLVPVITLIALLPVSVLGLGVKDGAFVFFFGGAGVSPSFALAVSLSSYGVIIGASVLLGLLATVVGPPLPSIDSARSAGPGRDPP